MEFLSKKEYTDEMCQKILDDNKEKTIIDGVVLLKPTSRENIQKLRDYIETIDPDIMVQSFPSIETGKKDIPYLRYAPYKKDNTNLKSKRKNAAITYYQKHYDEAIVQLREIIKYKFPYPKDYALLGLCYLKKNKTSLALLYLQIATHFSIRSDNKYNFTRLIEKIKGNKNVDSEEDKNETKSYAYVKEEEFSDSGIEVPNLRIVLYLMQVGMDVLEASKHAKLSFEDIQLLYLLFASEYYKIGNKEYGDYYLNAVKKCTNKSSNILHQIKRIEKTRKVLLNQNCNTEESLLHGLKRVKPAKLEE